MCRWFDSSCHHRRIETSGIVPARAEGYQLEMNLIIDIGNTRTKAFVFDGDQLLTENIFLKFSVSALKKITSHHRVRASILSSVVKNTGPISSWLKKNTNFTELSHRTRLPIKNLYKSKETLGNDRIANAVAAAKLFPGRHCLVIDAGTCVKYDFINSRKEYLGGAISPGMKMRFQSLHDYTSKLPLVKPSGKIVLTGNNTSESILSGVQLGILNEMEGYIRLYIKKYKNIRVILTGGDANSFAHLLNFPIFAAPKLTANGLNEILQHYIEKK